MCPAAEQNLYGKQHPSQGQLTLNSINWTVSYIPSIIMSDLHVMIPQQEQNFAHEVGTSSFFL